MYIYHGTSIFKDKAIPILHKRTRKNCDGEIFTIFNDVSFHGTPHYWIALAYTYSVQTFSYNGKKIYYNVSIDLYNQKKEIIIHGYKSLNHSLIALYQNGGYILTFTSDLFFHTNGLGTMECITKEITLPKLITHIHNPVSLMKEQGVVFKFLDLSLLKNKSKRNYVD